MYDTVAAVPEAGISFSFIDGAKPPARYANVSCKSSATYIDAEHC
jgi:hypothetical protein